MHLRICLNEFWPPNRAKINLLGAKQAQFKRIQHMPLPKFGFKFSRVCIFCLESELESQISFDNRFRSTERNDNEVKSMFVLDWESASTLPANLYLNTDWVVNKKVIPRGRNPYITSGTDILRLAQKIGACQNIIFLAKIWNSARLHVHCAYPR